MDIRNMFSKNIDRDLNLSININHKNEDLNKSELEEYIFTTGLTKNLRTFFNTYKRGILENIDINCIWISGTSGCGKSHFLKIISFILENKEINKKNTMEYLIENNKIEDSILLSDMTLASYAKTDIIMFDIFNKYNHLGVEDKKTVTEILIEEFSSILKINVSNSDFLHQEEIADKTDEEKLAIMINEYLSNKAVNHKIVFLIDNIDLYIEDNANQIESLQLIVDKLSKLCSNKVCLVVTGQQNLKTILSKHNDDYMDLLYKFNTNISISSSDREYIIREKILGKNENGIEHLKKYYKDNSTRINNLLFSTKETGRYRYIGEDDFIKSYPFVPEHFNLIFKIIALMKENGLLRESFNYTERSIISIFQEVILADIINLQNMEIVTLYKFYTLLHEMFVNDKEFSIINASNNQELNEMDLNVLKTLFLTKQVNPKGLDIEDITTMMITNFEQERSIIKEKVEKSLESLIDENYVDKIDDNYIYLTTEELEIYEDLNELSVKSEEFTKYISEIIFNKYITKSEFEYKQGYKIKYNQIIDNSNYLYDDENNFNLIVLTPFAIEDEDIDFDKLILADNNIIIKMPEDNGIVKKVENTIRLKKFIDEEEINSTKEAEDYKELKKKELDNLIQEISNEFYKLMEASEIYIAGEKLEFEDESFEERINLALEKSAIKIYEKMSYIDEISSVYDIENMLKKDSLELEYEELPNQKALDEVFEFIETELNVDEKISLKDILDRFSSIPYGFTQHDILWLIAVLFRYEKIKLLIDDITILLTDLDFNEIAEAIISRNEIENIYIVLREKVNPSQIQVVKDVFKELFEIESNREQDDLLMLDFVSSCTKSIYDLNDILENNHNIEPRNPGREIIEKYIDLFDIIIDTKDNLEFFKLIETKKDDLLEHKDELKQINELYNSDKKDILNKAFNIIDNNSFIINSIEDDSINDIVNNIKEIISVSLMENLGKLELNIKDYQAKYDKYIQDEVQNVINEINTEKDNIISKLEEYNDSDNLIKTYKDKFQDILSNVDDLKSLNEIKFKRFELKELKLKFISDTDNCETTKNNSLIKMNHININKLLGDNLIKIESNADIDDFLEYLKEKIISEKQGVDVLRINR